MQHSKLAALIGALFLGGNAGHAIAQAPKAPTEQPLPEVEVRAPAEPDRGYAPRPSSTATGLELSPRETPQSVSTVTREQMDDFGIRDVNDALQSTTGVTVERVETDRTYYTARGFDITNFQVDGVGLPFVYGNLYGNLDTAFYERIEVLRGGTGLMAGMSDPSATVNFVRKRPTRLFQASAGVTAGSWNQRRVDADVSGALTAAGAVRARVVAAHQDGESYLDRYTHEKAVLYGVVEADLGARTLLTLGHGRQENRAKSPLWGALPLYTTDGAPTSYDVSTSTAADWAYWNTDTTTTFAELTQRFANGWQAKAVLTRNKAASDSKLFYVYGTPNPTTPGSDLFSFPSRYDSANLQTIVDVQASGPFALAGRTHQLVVGANRSKSSMKDISHYGVGIGTEIPHLETWDGSYPEPAFTAGTAGSDWVDRQTSIYGAARFSVTDHLSAIAGARVTDLDSGGTSYGVNRKKTYDGKVTPYAGVVYDLTRNYAVYGSFTKLFRPQFEVDINGNRLDAVDGKAYEVGIKRESLDKKLILSAALFKTRQNNLAELTGFSPSLGSSYHTASDRVESSGYELDIAGEVAPGWQLVGGFTYVKIQDDKGDYTRTYIPKRMLRLSTTYRVPMAPGLKLGMRVKWQDDIYIQHAATATTGPSAGSPIRTEERGYALVDLMASYDFAKQWSVQFNVNNVTSKKHYQSLYWGSWGQAYYGAPRHANVTLKWKF